jgi:metacaspase-1
MGTVNLIDNVKEAVHLAQAARDLLHGGFSMQKINDAKHLVAGAKSIIGGFTSRRQEPGLGKEQFVEGWEESKDVWSFAGTQCAPVHTWSLVYLLVNL